MKLGWFKWSLDENQTEYFLTNWVFHLTGLVKIPLEVAQMMNDFQKYFILNTKIIWKIEQK